MLLLREFNDVKKISIIRCILDENRSVVVAERCLGPEISFTLLIDWTLVFLVYLYQLIRTVYILSKRRLLIACILVTKY